MKVPIILNIYQKPENGYTKNIKRRTAAKINMEGESPVRIVNEITQKIHENRFAGMLSHKHVHDRSYHFFC